MKITYFENVSTIEELKKAYKKLAKQYHPDKNLGQDTNKIMATINNEYEFLFTNFKSNKGEKAHKMNSNYRNIIDELIKYADITIDIVGTWVWVYGDTYKVKDTIKGLGFKWSKSNKKWYWTETPLEGRKRAMSYDYKVSKYGVESMKTDNNTVLIED